MGDGYANCRLLDYPYFKGTQKMFVIAFSKQQALNDDTKEIQKLNFTKSFDWTGNATRFSFLKKWNNLNLIFQ